MLDLISIYREGVATFVGLASAVVTAIVATWDNLTGYDLLGENGIYDATTHDTSIFLLVVGLAVSGIIAVAVDDYLNKY